MSQRYLLQHGCRRNKNTFWNFTLEIQMSKSTTGRLTWLCSETKLVTEFFPITWCTSLKCSTKNDNMLHLLNSSYISDLQRLQNSTFLALEPLVLTSAKLFQENRVTNFRRFDALTFPHPSNRKPFEHWLNPSCCKSSTCILSSRLWDT